MATHPVQTYQCKRGAEIGTEVTLRAYEVYVALYGEQVALVTDGCRGGFAVSELIAFLYARSFPRDEWRRRVDEAMRRMKNL